MIENKEDIENGQAAENEVTNENESAENQEKAPESVENTVSAEEKLSAELNEQKEKFVRLYAEFDNYKRRSAKEKLDLLKTASQEIMTALLPVLDDFGRAIKSMDSAQDVAAVKDGVTLIHTKLTGILQNKGLKAMETTGKPFDADLMEGITQIPAPTEDLKGKVVDEIEKGYYLEDKVIRYAKVIVGA